MQKLEERGIFCTQATLSRDLRFLGAARIPDSEGNYHYTIPSKFSEAEGDTPEGIFGSSIREIVFARDLMILKTAPGFASSIAIALDKAGRFEIAGTMAGDDTVMVVPRDGVAARELLTSLSLVFPEQSSQFEDLIH